MPLIDPELMKILACPCEQHAPLREIAPGEHPAAPEGALQCTDCARVFPIREGIPVLLLDEALEPR